MVLSMNRKKVFLLISFVLMMSLVPGVVSAQDDGILGGLADTIQNLFGFIPEVITLEKLVGEDEAAVFWAKFLIWVLLFAVIYFGATAVPGLRDNNRIAIIIAIVISIISTVMIPAEIIFDIFQTYGLVSGIALWFIPLAAILYINHKLENRWLKVLVLMLALIILVNINTTLSRLGGIGEWFDYFGLLLAFVVIMLIWNLFTAFGGEGAGEGARDWASNQGRDFLDWATGGGDRERRGERGRERAREREVEEAEDLNRKLDEKESELREALRRTEADEIQRLQVLAGLLRELVEMQEQLKGFKDVQRRYDGLIGRIIQELDRLFSDLLEDKNNIMKIRNTMVRELYAEKTMLIAIKKAEMETKLEESNQKITPKLSNEINSLQEKLKQLIIDKIAIERREAIAIKDDPARIEKEIGEIKAILKYIKDKAGSKGKRRNLTREDAEEIYNKIKDVYNSVLTRKEELDLTKRFEQLKKDIEKKAEQIIKLINTIIEGIPSAGGPSDVSGAGQGPSGVVSKVEKKEAKEIEGEVKEARKVVTKQKGYFMLIDHFAKPLVKITKSKVERTEKLRKAESFIAKLRTFERREQLRASVSKLEGALKRVLNLPLTPDIRKNIARFCKGLEVYEGKVLTLTVGIAKKIQRGDVDLEEDTKHLKKYILAQIALLEKLEDELVKMSGGISLKRQTFPSSPFPRGGGFTSGTERKAITSGAERRLITEGRKR